jgi:hypothetical protein
MILTVRDCLEESQEGKKFQEVSRDIANRSKSQAYMVYIWYQCTNKQNIQPAKG